jgi:hypothetical protein
MKEIRTMTMDTSQEVPMSAQALGLAMRQNDLLERIARATESIEAMLRAGQARESESAKAAAPPAPRAPSPRAGVDFPQPTFPKVGTIELDKR